MAALEVVSVHEDDYGQIELLPMANWRFCEEQLGQVVAEQADMGPRGVVTAVWLDDETPVPSSIPLVYEDWAYKTTESKSTLHLPDLRPAIRIHHSDRPSDGSRD